VEVRLLRNATLLINIKGRVLLLDPMLSPPGVLPPAPSSSNDRRNPLVALPEFDPATVNAVLVTHTHVDHFDGEAAELLRKDLPLICQPQDEEKLRSYGFEDVRPIPDSALFEDVELIRTGGRHGTGELGERMGPVSGFVLRAEGEPTLYVAGDTVWCREVEQTLEQHAPQVVVVNAGAARVDQQGGPITMSAEDVVRVAQTSPGATVLAVHMEAVNHCLLTREQLAERLAECGVAPRVRMPADGETVRL
jgi:L-ascorbate metabolism protein UlaG (beta-lactamase superfamily)